MVALYFIGGTLLVTLYLVGTHYAEVELRLAWDGFRYIEDPETGKVFRQERHDLRDPEDMKYWPAMFSWICYIIMRSIRRGKEKRQLESTSV